MTIYLAVKSVQNSFGYQILGAYKEFSSAKHRCLAEHSFTKSGWKSYNTNEWNNGSGLSVSVIETDVLD